MYVFGINVAILELLVILSTFVVIYLILLELEFRQIRKIEKHEDISESTLMTEVQEFRKEIQDLRSLVDRLEGKKKK